MAFLFQIVPVLTDLLMFCFYIARITPSDLGCRSRGGLHTKRLFNGTLNVNRIMTPENNQCRGHFLKNPFSSGNVTLKKPS